MVKVSIIVPIYKVEKYLKRCLESLVSQTFQEIEIICVNDGSPDQSQDIVDEYVKKYPHLVKDYLKENGGLSDARNYGLNLASGDYVAFIDSDDWVEPEMIEKMYKAAIEQEADLVICDFIMDWEKTGKSNYIKGIEHENMDILKSSIISPPSAWNKLYRKNLFSNTGIIYPKGLWYEDLATIPRLLINTNKIAYVNEAFIHYIQREGSIMTTVNEKMLDIYSSIQIVEKYYREKGVYNNYKNEIEFLYIRHLILDMNLRFIQMKNGDIRVKKSLQHMSEIYPNWFNNPYNNSLSRKDRFIMKLLRDNHLFILKTCIFIKQKIINRLG